MDLGGWLLSLGLEQYEAAFRDNAIDEAILPTLTAQDLKELGVVIVGDRRKLLNAIAALRANSLATPLDGLSVIDAPLPDAAERRQVTVMFSDLGRFNGTVRTHGSGRPARGHFGLSEMRCRDRASLRGLRVRSTWATGFLFTSAIRKPTKTMQNGRCAQGWSWSRQ